MILLFLVPQLVPLQNVLELLQLLQKLFLQKLFLLLLELFVASTGVVSIKQLLLELFAASVGVAIGIFG